MSKFSERLKELRLENKLTQMQLANATHISQTSISAYESGRSQATEEVIITFCRFFDVSADFILGLSD